MKTNIYIDGFNLYYAIKEYKSACYKWLDVATLCERLLDGHDIHRIRYFTARVRARSEKPGQTLRQQVYLRALRTIPNLEIHEGVFLTSNKWSVIANPPAEGLPTIPGVIEPHAKTGALMARVVKVEEKGSDVNIAMHLLLDGFRSDYEQAVIITNDSDLVGPIKMVRTELGLEVGVLNPHRKKSFAIEGVASFYRPISEDILAASQFPSVIVTPKGKITKPITWRERATTNAARSSSPLFGQLPAFLGKRDYLGKAGKSRSALARFLCPQCGNGLFESSCYRDQRSYLIVGAVREH